MEDVLGVGADEVFDVLPLQVVQLAYAVLVVLAERLQRVEGDKLGLRRLEGGREERRDGSEVREPVQRAASTVDRTRIQSAERARVAG